MSAEDSNSRDVGFSEALEATLPILLRMKKTLRNQPKATKASLERLSAISAPAQTLKSIAQKAPPMSPKKTASQPPAGQTDDGRLAKLDELRKNILSCTRCPNLVASRTQVVYGVGNPFAELLFVGEAPGEEEDLRGEPFIGKAGQLLTKIIGAMEYTREEIFIANVLKCRPDMPAGESGNRKPKPAEMATCLPWLTQQIELIRPKVIVALGLTAVEGLLGEPRTMRDVRGKWLDYHGVPLMPTYHPAYLLRNQTLAEKRKVWEDMLLVLGKLGRPISEKQRGYFLEKA
jgi:uracil-DNA glycosylase family 4